MTRGVTFRPAPLRAAAVLAAAFIAVRVLYRVLFHGADGTGPVVLPLPQWRLPPPFAHVVMFGPVTVDGLWDAAVSALPIALTILAFGALSALLDMPRLIARGARRGPLQGLARAVSIAWATLPSLADAVRAARFAQRLRGERGGVRLLAPVLEHTLERATAVAAALELRGYAGRELAGECRHPVALREAAAGFGTAGAAPVVTVPHFDLSPGTLTVLTGATGSGKTTLLRVLSGLHAHVDGGWTAGSVRVVGHDRGEVPPRDVARCVGVVLQHPRAAFATGRVADEIGLALELRGVARVLIDARVREVADRVGVTGLLDRDLRGLSAGEATLVAIAAAIVEQPILLLVDEPLADLDAAARERIVALLGALAHEAGICVVVAEHRADEFSGVADRWLTVDQAAVRAALPAETPRISAPEAPVPGSASGSASNPWSSGARTARAEPQGEPILERSGITVRHGDRVVVDAAALTLQRGEIAALRGPNGAGKSSLLVALATGAHATAIALVPDDSDALFVRDTVAAECRRVDRRHRLVPGTTAARFGELLSLAVSDPALTRRLHAHPRDLSAGERRCLAIVVQTAGAPGVLLLDEPTRGLDPDACGLVARAIVAQAEAGTAVLFATHDAAFAALADRELRMDAGVLAAVPAPALAPAPALTTSEICSSAEQAAAISPKKHRSPRDPEPAPRGKGPRRWHTPALVAANLAAAAAFLWPLIAIATPSHAQAAVPYIALSLAPLAVVLVLAALDASVRSAHTLALLAMLAAIGAAIRIASTGVGGVEALFVLLILAGRAYGARFGLLLGAASIALSALMWGGVGPWLPFQMFACGWVGAGAGLLPRRVRGIPEIVMLAAYVIVASYAFGLIMNMWFWPFAVGADTSISYVPGGSLGENLGNFLVYSLLTSTLSWDTLRAITTIIGLALVGRALLRSLRRAKPVATPTPSPAPLVVAVPHH
ncbi:ATP-binding cassette domain-containing protein [Microbacterium aurum]|uniref:ATP-binding cassette domain-containing protein n=1 Tax=Microbacterium aurum TaxID=36805 RepID=UPI001E4C1A99|nr:ATP-binding cassette domain-containing protein [Microbacterium aurum]MBM7827239.1 energy-coupling factor transport system ATP-binding protein [Microbacterium aurum]